MSDIVAAAPRTTNADLIVDCRDLDYLRPDDLTLDATFGRGTWWTRWAPERLVTSDLAAGAPMLRADFTRLPFPDRTFDAVAYDPPYKLNGTPDTETDVDERYGVGRSTRWQDRMELMRDGLADCARVARRTLLVKCQDQVCSGQVRWQTLAMIDAAEVRGFDLVDMLHMLGGRPQPAGRRQVHARRNYSTLLVFQRKAKR